MITTPLRNVLVLGAGKVGSTIADMVAEAYQWPVTLADQRAPATADDALVRHLQLDVCDTSALAAALSQHTVVINALPYFLARTVASEAARLGVHYFDLTEDVAATQAIRQLAVGSRSLLMPQCGLAPGVIGMLGMQLAGGFDELFDLNLRVGALTRHATNRLRYNFTWSIDGVINEYCQPCEAIVQGQRVSTQPLEGLEQLLLEGDLYEAFNTSGGLGTLCETLQGRVRNLSYKTLRYPGHRDAMDFLLHDLRLIEQRELLRQVLDHAVPHSRDDVVLVHASATGLRQGRLEQQTRLARVLGAPLRGRQRTAIELSTAAGVVGVLELLQRGQLPAAGFVRQEQVPLQALLATRVGHHYAGLREVTGSGLDVAGVLPPAEGDVTAKQVEAFAAHA